jgi:adenylyltransferase/sulfurtransferase
MGWHPRNGWSLMAGLQMEHPVRLDDLQIERYSRQIVLPEIGPRGQSRLLAARVVIHGGGPAAERAVGYLAAAGVGKITASRALHALIDPGQADVTLETLESTSDSTAFDAAVLTGEQGNDAASEQIDPTRLPHARRTFWIAGGRAAELPPCPACAIAGLPPVAAAAPELRLVRDALLGTVIATEVMKALLGIGTPLRGQVLTYDPGHATLTVSAVAPRPVCARCTASLALED